MMVIVVFKRSTAPSGVWDLRMKRWCALGRVMGVVGEGCGLRLSLWYQVKAKYSPMMMNAKAKVERQPSAVSHTHGNVVVCENSKRANLRTRYIRLLAPALRALTIGRRFHSYDSRVLSHMSCYYNITIYRHYGRKAYDWPRILTALQAQKSIPPPFQQYDPSSP